MIYLSERFSKCLPVLLSLSFSILFLRAYEIVLVLLNHIIHVNLTEYILKGFLTDLFSIGFLWVIFSTIILLLTFLNVSLIRSALFTVSVIFLIIHTALIQYFTELLIPLGADLYAYSYQESKDTVLTSINSGFDLLWPFLFSFSVYSICYYFIKDIDFTKKWTTYTYSGFVLLGFIFLFQFSPDKSSEKETTYNLTSNKSVHFFKKSYHFLFESGDIEPYAGEEFPLYKKTDFTDQLSDLIEPGNRPPNLVFIVIESFGGSFMEPNAAYGGFTPFLDSLANESLYWTHFLSTSGRSFGLLPSLFGSLPAGQNGFMEMGPLAPDHQTLIRILGDNNYHTAYFCGYESSFDNVNIFLEQQDIDLIVDANRFNNNYSKMEEIGAGFTWGYEDKQTFRRAFDFLDQMDSDQPRLDIYFTLNLHEPFIISDQQKYLQRVRKISESPEFDKSKKRVIDTYEKIFAAILYTDDAVKELINRYKKRDDFENTIFIITGDHRLAPIPHKNLIDRFYVPFMIFSPRIRQPVKFHSVSSHNEVTPTLLAYLHNQYKLSIPENNHWIGDQIDMSRSFNSIHSIPLMRNKNQMVDYLEKDLFLSESRLFRLKEGMHLETATGSGSYTEINEKLTEFQQINRYVTTENKLMPVTDELIATREEIESDYLYLRENQLEELSLNQLFEHAQKLAFNGDYTDARTVLRVILRERPGFYDARLLLGRTYGWEGEYNKAEAHFREVVNRKPDYADSYAALADLSYWNGENEKALELINKGLEFNTTDSSLLFRKARTLWILKKNAEALSTLERLLDINPEHKEGLQLLERLQRD